MILPFGRNVKTGYLKKQGDDWYVQPAQMPSSLNLPEQGAYLKVKEYVLERLPGYILLNDAKNYSPQLHEVSFEVEIKRGSRGNYAAITKLAPASQKLQYTGVLVCSGNMLETGKSGQRTPRKNQALVLPPDSKAPEVKIDKEVVQGYLAGLTPFQKENLWGGEKGCLKEGAPVFYVEENKKVKAFGHNPFFRVPALVAGTNRAAMPLDMVPDGLRDDSTGCDLADILFGWTPEPDGKRRTSRAGQVFFGDATLLPGQTDIWYSKGPIIPRVLASPKATTFQHYLVQDAEKGHAPDVKESLAHYGTPTGETQIRGHKFYWFKGAQPKIEFDGSAEDKEKHKSQLTRIRPLKAGVRFKCSIRFENLRPEELGALVWALQPKGETSAVYRHHLGMGKPLGMGAVAINPEQIILTNRKEQRYASLFSEGNWQTGAAPVDKDYRADFEVHVLTALKKAQAEHASSATRLADLPRIRDLLTMMTWSGDDPGEEWLDWTRYMEIERPTGRRETQNEYKERPVLPTPGEAFQWMKAGPPVNAQPQLPKQQPASQQKPAVKPPQQSPALSVVDPVELVPKPEDIVRGEVIDVDPNGTVTVELTDLPHKLDVIAIIRPEKLQGKQYREGNQVRLKVLKVDGNEKIGWELDCEPASQQGKKSGKIT